MSTEPRKPVYATDPNTWPIADAVPTDVFLGTFDHDCTPHLTDEQKSWPVVECEPTDIFLDPVLVLDLTVRESATQPELVYGTAELLRALDARETASGGSGLILDPRRHPGSSGKVRLVLYPKTEASAKERLQQLADLLEHGENSLAVIPRTVVGAAGSFVECHAVMKPQ